MAVQLGDDFAVLVEPYRAELHAHCYRMLGSVFDADDALQEALLRAWRGLERFEGRSSLRTWLYTIATNACLKAIERRPKRVLPIDYGPPSDLHDELQAPLSESVWIDPYLNYEQRERIELAFIAALQHLPAAQRAVLILRDVLGFSGAEVAQVLDTTPAAVYSALQRAHRTIDKRAGRHAPADAGLRELVAGFVDAWQRDDVGALVALLAEDAALAMPPRPTWFRGRKVVGEFLREVVLDGSNRWRNVVTTANGQPALEQYIWRGDRFAPHGVVVLTVQGDRITELTAFLDPRLLERG